MTEFLKKNLEGRTQDGRKVKLSKLEVTIVEWVFPNNEPVKDLKVEPFFKIKEGLMIQVNQLTDLDVKYSVSNEYFILSSGAVNFLKLAADTKDITNVYLVFFASIENGKMRHYVLATTNDAFRDTGSKIFQLNLPGDPKFGFKNIHLATKDFSINPLSAANIQGFTTFEIITN